MKLTIMLLLSLIFISQSCTSEEITSINPKGSGQISIALDKQNAPNDVTKVIITLIGPNDSNIIKSLDLNNGSDTGILFEDIAVGTWHILVDAINDEDVVLYSGETYVNVLPDIIVPVHLQLNPTTGGVLLTVTWGSNNPADNYLLGHFPFDSNANDNSNYENNGTIFDGTFTKGILGGALTLDGNYDYCLISHQEQYNSDEKTIMFWMYKDNDYIRDTPGLSDVEGLVLKAWDTGLNRDFSFAISNPERF